MRSGTDKQLLLNLDLTIQIERVEEKMKRNLMWLVLMAVMMAGCVPPTVTPTVNPVTVTPSVTLEPATKTPVPVTATATRPTSPIITPVPVTATATRFVSPIVTPAPSTATVADVIAPATVFTASLVNGNFENPFGHPDGVTEWATALGWRSYSLDVPPCRPGSAGCPIPCPSNCLNENGKCQADTGCAWARAEFKQMWYLDYTTPKRTYEIFSSQGSHVAGRMGVWGDYQRVRVGVGNIVTFTIRAMTWMCFDGDDCKLGHMNDARRAQLVAAWGCLDWYTCRNWTASDIPKYLRLDLPRAGEPITPTMHMRAGIDPTGTFSPSVGTANFANVVWGREKDTFDIWTELVVTATAKSEWVTVLSHAQPEWPYAHWNNDAYWDGAAVRVEVVPRRVYTNYLPMVIKR